MKTKEIYNTPEMEQIELLLEQTIAASGDGRPGDDDTTIDMGDVE